MNSTLLCVLLTVSAPTDGAPTAGTEIDQQITSVLTDQVDAWNRGDIDAFMETYWKSDKLSFSSGGQTTRGWKATRDRYHDRYPNRDAMGKLNFSELEITQLGDDAALMLGRWQLERAGDKPGGNFSLVMRKVDGQWKIIHDHTSKSD
jgi:beta-aspartyl-peptidase (threonine type)